MPMHMEVVQQVGNKTRLPFGVRLMAQKSGLFMRKMVKIGAQQMCFHYESAFHVDQMPGLTRESEFMYGSVKEQDMAKRRILSLLIGAVALVTSAASARR